MKVSQKGIDLITSFEGYASKPYRDLVGVLTWGYGHAQKKGETPPSFLTQEQAIALLKQDITQYEDGVSKVVRVPINQNQFDALVSFAYNLGVSKLAGSTLLAKLNSKDFAGAANEFTKWNRAGGKEVNGLTRRRKAEQKLFTS